MTVHMKNLIAESIDLLPLFVHHIVIFKGVLAHRVIALLDTFLRCFNRFIEHSGGNRLSFRRTERLQESRSSGARQKGAEGIFKGDIEFGGSRISLAGAAAAQLSVDAARLVACRADDIEAAEICHTWFKFNVGSASGHVGGNGDCSALARSAIISASLSLCLALRTVCSSLFCLKMRDSFSETSTDSVPIRMGRPFSWISRTSLRMALYFSRSVM